jgi:DMSO/TMAO reductase YedYZ heme-binding membrane subunit
VALWPGTLTRWLRANRRYVGVAFAGSHAVHAVAIAAFGILDRAEFMQQTMVANFAFGGLAYGFIVAMAATSFNRSAAWLGTKAWGRLHAIGGFYVWVTFFVSAAKRAIYTPSYWVYVAVLVAILGVKLAARIRAAPARNSAVGAK